MKTTETQSFRHRSTEVRKINKSSVTVVRMSVRTEKPPVEEPTPKRQFSSLPLQEAPNATPKRK